MTLALTADFWAKEIRAAHNRTKMQLLIFESQIARYHTPFYKGLGEVKEYDPENHAYQFITGIVPQMVYQNPRVRVDSGKAGIGSAIATMYKNVLNKRIREINFEEIVTELAHDTLFQYAVAMVIDEKDYRYPVKGGYAMNPVIVRIPQEDFLMDPIAYRRGEARWMGHIWRVDKEDLQERADKENGWDKKAIDALPVDRGIDKSTGLEREEVSCVDVYIPGLFVDDDIGPEDGFFGTELTFAWTGNDIGVILRPARPAFAPATGRYKLCDVSYVPNQPFGLSPLVAAEGPMRELNRMTKRMIAMQMRYARITLVEDGDAAFAQKLRDAEMDLILPVRSLETNRVQSIERGGNTEQMLSMTMEARQRLDRNASTSDSFRGAVEKKATATAEALADANENIRTDQIVNRFHSFSCQLVDDIAFHFWHNEDSRSFLGGDFLADIGIPKIVIEQLGIPGFEYKGGDAMFPAYKGVSFNDLNISFEPLSMGRTTEDVAQRRALQALGMTAQIKQFAALYPNDDWSQLANLVGDALNIPDFAEIAGVSQPGMGMQQPQLQQPQPAGAPQPPPTGLPGNEAGAAARMVG